jgi:hypothetical protein
MIILRASQRPLNYQLFHEDSARDADDNVV